MSLHSLFVSQQKIQIDRIAAQANLSIQASNKTDGLSLSSETALILPYLL